MNHTTYKTSHLALATISIVVLLSAAIVVPYLSAFADPSTDIKNTQGHKKDRKGLDPANSGPQRCLHGSSAKYNKHCF